MPNSPNKPDASMAATALLLAGCLAVNLAASICFKEGGTDQAHRWTYFIGGNALGISATVLMMLLYPRLNVNVAMVFISSGLFILTQALFWMIYHTPLTGLQFLGIGLITSGTVLATWPKPTVASKAVR